MRALQRLPEPQILIHKKKEWLDNFLTSGKNRPDSSKYAHESIRRDLISMSFDKCFYCETKLTDQSKEVDHHVEVSIDKNGAFEWTNLCLSCTHCNKKLTHNVIAVSAALNPCTNTNAEIQKHLTFEEELIKPNHNSNLGLETIKKYRLNSDLLDYKRLKHFKLFTKLIIEILTLQKQEHRNHLTQQEREAIESFKRIDNPYSLMFEVAIEKNKSLMM